MRNEAVETGKTVEEAIGAACLKLGCERDECEWEIIDLPKKGFLGLKNIPAKVRVFVEVPDPPQAKPAAQPKPPQQPRAPKEPKPEPRQEQSAGSQAAEAPRGEAPRGEAPRGEAPRGEAPRAEAPRGDKPEVNYRLTPPSDEVKAKASAAAAYLTAVLEQMQLQVQVEQVWDESGVCLAVQGDGLGAIIGRRGETLDALQYLSGLVANRMEGDYLRVTVDCGDYRLKRRATLEALARKVSAQVLKTNVSKTLEPMNPFERRIIHATVSTVEGVSSTSIGEEPNRRVVITTPTAKGPRRGGSGRGRSFDRPERSGSSGGRDRARGDRDRSDRDRGGRGRSDRDSRGGRDRDRSDRDRGTARRERPAAYQPTNAPENPPTEAENTPLYGKIDLE